MNFSYLKANITIAIISKVAKIIKSNILLKRYNNKGISKGGEFSKDILKMANSSLNYLAILIIL